MTQICPYSGEAAEEFSDEHIFPHALGGGLDYKLRVSKKSNQELGDTIDAALINSPLIQAVRTELGIRSRSGEPTWQLTGTVRGTDTRVELTFRQGQEMIQRVINPITTDVHHPNSKIISGSKDDFDKFLRTFIRNHERKGHIVELGPETSLINQPLDVDLTFDMAAVKRALGKIAFASLIHYLPEYINDPLVPEWRKLMSGSPEEAMQARIYGTAFDADQILPTLFPKLQPYEHGVTIGTLQKNRVLVAVSLFGLNFHHIIAVASDHETYGIGELCGRIAICDARNRTTRFIDYNEAWRDKLLAIFER